MQQQGHKKTGVDETVVGGVWWDQSVCKAEERLQGERQRLEEARERMGTHVAGQRTYFGALTRLKEECAKGEKLEERVKLLGRSGGEQETV